MSLFDQLGGVLSNVIGGNLSEQEVHSHYDQIAQAVPPNQIGAVVGPAMQAIGPEETQKRVANSAQQMTPEQRGGLMGQLLGGLSSSGVDVGSLLKQLGVDPSVASQPQNATPEDVGAVASHAQTADPDLFHRAMGFYAQHPTLVKALGAMVIAQIASRLGQK